MAATVIELDLSTPWEPPPPRPRLRGRWVPVCTVLAVVLGGLGVAGVAPRRDPLYHLDEQVRTVTVTGDVLIVGRYRQGVSDPGLEGRRRSDGAVLWSIPTDLQQQFVMPGTDALILVRHTDTDDGYTSALTAVDPATGRELWTRPKTSIIGTGSGLAVVEELTEPFKVIELPAGQEPSDPTVNDAGDPQPRHILMLDERTGTPVWELTAPPGTVLDFTWSGRFPGGQVTGVDQLDPAGLVTRRDIRTGAVRSTRQLDWAGTPAILSTGAAWLVDPRGVPGRAVVYPDGERGGLVFDLADGRRLFRTDIAAYDGLHQCAAHLFCVTGERDVTAYDSTTGAPAWHVEGYGEVAASRGNRLVLSSVEQAGSMSGRMGILDARTGAVITELTDWRLIRDASGGRILLWRALDQRTALLGELDPATGGVTVFGRARDWYGPPDCSTDGDTLACVMIGDTTVWRLPSRQN